MAKAIIDGIVVTGSVDEIAKLINKFKKHTTGDHLTIITAPENDSKAQ